MAETTTPIRLTELVSCGGCASKAPMGELASVLKSIPPATDPRVLVDMRTSDDAGVYQLTDEIAIVQTVDFFTPLVDDPYMWGAIAATNALSDVYAMGGIPITALNITAFPKSVPYEVLGEVLRGAADKCREAGVAILGGHTVEDESPKFGLAVTGTIHPKKVVTNATARAGDVLILTKPLGLGIVNSGVKKQVTPKPLYELAIKVMTTLNRAASEAMLEVGVNAATDVTGFAFLGHLSEMCLAANLGADISFSKLPILPGVAEVRAAGATTRVPKQLYRHLEGLVTLDAGLDDLQKELLADPQTSGGLLMSVPPEREAALHDALRKRGVEDARSVGTMTAEAGIVVHP